MENANLQVNLLIKDDEEKVNAYWTNYLKQFEGTYSDGVYQLVVNTPGNYYFYVQYENGEDVHEIWHWDFKVE